MSSNSLSLLVDRVRYTVLKAPDRFPADTGMNLTKCFDDIFLQIENSSDVLSDQSEKVKSLSEKALEMYIKGEVKEGIKCLQEVDLILREVK